MEIKLFYLKQALGIQSKNELRLGGTFNLISRNQISSKVARRTHFFNVFGVQARKCSTANGFDTPTPDGAKKNRSIKIIL